MGRTKKKRCEDVITIRDAHLKRLGISSTDEINSWWKKGAAGAYTVYGLEKACSLIWEYKDKTVYIMGDYDVDGITATSILVLALRWLGFLNVRYRIPKRFTEGFGMNKNMVDEITEDNVLIITVDNGIAAADVVQYAMSRGFKVIVTDHHEPSRENGTVMIPDADMVIDPKVMPGLADFDGYCGAGIAYRLARRLLGEKDTRLQYLLALAAIGTVCDQMYIREENYYIVRRGLRILNEGRMFLPGLHALRSAMGFSQWTSDAIAFQTGPAINAAERMRDGGAREAVELLISDDPAFCTRTADELVQTNQERKKLVAESIEKAEKQLERDENENVLSPIVEYIPGCHEGIIGIIAGKLCEKYGVPAGVFGDTSQKGILKGSFRAPEGFSIKALLDECKSKFVVLGGHASAAGASVRKARFKDMKASLREHAGVLPASEDVLLYDVEIESSDVPAALEEEMKYEPFGNGNERLVFKVISFEPVKTYDEWMKQLRGNGVKIRSEYSEAVGFGIADSVHVNGPSPITIYGTLSMNTFNGVSTPQIQIIEVE